MSQIRKAGRTEVSKNSDEAKAIEKTHGFAKMQKRKDARDKAARAKATDKTSTESGDS